MISLKRRPLRRVAWFVAGLLCTLLFALPSVWQPATAISSSNRVETVKHFDTKAKLAAWSNRAFEEFAASHLEPNFYQ
ncbi:hypothetical protein H6F98_03635 [Microcoleus sp. FACHB-SPT15]|uniref:hypothetical protein n=1 Tax=Microcoleus sp. FACHB-SPT15 TaxID=2692830 RepID=UPI00177BDCFB|nr:hypothetical protein [Microcoleus sp. FACHB-SPT15]MBD1804565.1 hypothetical protein [Microcoleus sp. FACHB-SPT15]